MDARLAETIAVLDQTRLAAQVFSADWRLVHMTAAQVVNMGTQVPPGAHALSEEFRGALIGAGTLIVDEFETHLQSLLPFMVATHPGGRDGLLAAAAPALRGAVESTPGAELPPLWTRVMTVRPRGFQPFPLRAVIFRIDGADGRFAGAAELWLPALSGDLLGLITLADTAHLERLGRVTQARRRPAAILFADLEASTPLARRLSTDAYFRLIRHVMRAVDDLVVKHGGLVGRHVGDGLTAYYPAELCGGEAQAARAAAATARQLGGAVIAAAAAVPGAGQVLVNAGLHWGSTVRLGAMLTAARFEVTALGEEVNEAARIEACATGGNVLASKALVERLDDEAIEALGIDPDASYLTLADVPGAPEKARRDAPTLAVRPL